MKTRGIITLGMGWVALMFSACTAELGAGEMPEPGTAGNPLVPLCIETAQAESVATRAGTAIELPVDGTIGISRRKDAKYSEKKNIPYQQNDMGWNVLPPTTALMMNLANATMGAYYPYDDTMNTALTLTAQAWTEEKEILYTPFAASSMDKASLILKHAYSRMRITFKKDEDGFSKGTGHVTTLKVSGTGIYTTAQLDVTKSWGETPYSAYAGDTDGVALTGLDLTANTTTDKQSLLMLPVATLTGNILFTATVDGKVMIAPIDASLFGGKLMPATQYNVTLTLRGTVLVVTSMKQTPWKASAVDGDHNIN